MLSIKQLIIPPDTNNTRVLPHKFLLPKSQFQTLMRRIFVTENHPFLALCFKLVVLVVPLVFISEIGLQFPWCDQILSW